MTQEDKELLLKDLCGRLLCGTFVRIKNYEGEERDVKITVHNIGYVLEIGNGWWVSCKPYLRSMSSMTEEEIREFTSLVFISDSTSYGSLKECVLFAIYSAKALDWLNKHHFDYRGLIEKGLALEAPKDMYD